MDKLINTQIPETKGKGDSRYSVVVAVAKRARQIAEGSPKLTVCKSEKPVTIAIQEMNDGKYTYQKKSSN